MRKNQQIFAVKVSVSGNIIIIMYYVAFYLCFFFFLLFAAFRLVAAKKFGDDTFYNGLGTFRKTMSFMQLKYLCVF